MNRPHWPIPQVNPDHYYALEVSLLEELATHPEANIRGMADSAMQGDFEALLMVYDYLLEVEGKPGCLVVLCVEDMLAEAVTRTEPEGERARRGFPSMTAEREQAIEAVPMDPDPEVFDICAEEDQLAYLQHMHPVNRRVLSEFLASRDTCAAWGTPATPAGSPPPAPG